MDLLRRQLRCDAAGDNVSWYFSAPRTPGAAGVALDRRTAYHAGPVDSDVGPLAIGNFNETMHGYGLDRQFRGEIRALQIFGSRTGGRGARSLAQIQGRCDEKSRKGISGCEGLRRAPNRPTESLQRIRKPSVGPMARSGDRP